jgi:hypothetical protein
MSFALCPLAGGERLRQLGPRLAPAALDLGVLAYQLPCPAVQPVAHRLALGLQAEARAPLLIGADAIIGDEFASMCW